MKNKSIRSVRVYQSVAFEGKQETTFIVKGTQRRKPVDAIINAELGGVELQSPEDHIFVPFTNISGIYFENDKSIAKEEDKKEELGRIKKINESKVDKTRKPR